MSLVCVGVYGGCGCRSQFYFSHLSRLSDEQCCFTKQDVPSLLVWHKCTKSVTRAHFVHFLLLNYMCNSTHVCKHTSDSCLLSRMLNVLQRGAQRVTSVETDCVLCEIHPNTRPSSPWRWSCKRLTRPHHSYFTRSIQASSCPRATTIHLCTVGCEKRHRSANVHSAV